MTGAAGMRGVIKLASDSLAFTLNHDELHLNRVSAMAYAKGVLDLLATYLVDAEPEGLRRAVVDGEGQIWEPTSGSDLWSCTTDPESDDAIRDEIVRRYGPVREVWVR